MQKRINVVFLSIMLLLFYLPILILALYSFTTSANIGTIHGFSVDNYIKLFTTEELTSMIWGTLFLAVGSAFLATILGTIGAVGSHYSKGLGNRSITMMNQIPVVNADVVTGFSVCIFLIVVLGIDKESYVPLVLGHTILSAPFVYLSVLPRLKAMDESLYEAARDLGASPAYALIKVVLPQIASGIISGFMMAVTLSLDDYFIATYTKPATFNTISTYVVNATKGSQTEIKTALWALSTIIFLVVLIIVFGSNMITSKSTQGTGGVSNEE